MAFTIKVVTTSQRDSEDVETVATRTFSGLTASELHKVVVNNSTVILWDTSTSGAIGNFDLLLLLTDVEVEVELTTKDGDADNEFSNFTLAANTCVVLGSDDARYTYTTDTFAGTLDVIDSIRVKELNSVAATVQLRLYT